MKKNEKSETITVVIVSDDHLIVMVAALIKSIEVNNRKNKMIDIYLISDGVKKRNVERINKTIESESINLIWKTLSEVIPSSIKLPLDKTTFPVCAYARICAPHFLRSGVSRVIYLDADMLLMTDISRLWQIDIAPYPIGAVVDRSEKVSSTWGGIKNYKELGMDPDSKYFNSGLLIIDIPKWKSMNAAEKIVETVNNNLESVTFADQYGLNIVFEKEWYEIDRRWNCYAQNFITNPFLIHFTGMKPIFRGYNHNSHYRDIFFEYLQLTPWAGFKPQRDVFRLFKKGWNVVKKRIS